MRQFHTEGDWAIDENGWRVGRVFRDAVGFKPNESGPPVPIHNLPRVEFFDRRYVQVGGKVLTALERQEVGVIELGVGT